nr:PKD domain-containing protein [uncultured Psychroserpens sp.]
MKKTITLLILMLSFLYSGTVLAQVPIVTYNYPSLDDGFHFKVTTTTANETFTIPTNGTGYNYLVYWGDGGYPIEYSGNVTHTFTNAGTYLVELVPYNVTVTYSNVGTTLYETWNPDWTGFPGIYFNNTGDKDKIVSIEQWGNGVWSGFENAFYGCSNLVNNAADTPAEIIGSMRNAFNSASMFNASLGNWPIAPYVGDFTDALSNSGLSIANYNNTLIGWSTKNVNPGRTLGADGLSYCGTAIAARNILTTTKGWTINGDTQLASCPPTTTYVPDANFETYLETHNASGNLVTLGDPTSMGNGILNDNQVTTASIEFVTGLNISNQNISNITGIESFTNLELLSCNNNPLTSIVVNNNLSLRYLLLKNTLITELDVSLNTDLISVNCQNVPGLNHLDVSQNPNLSVLFADGSGLQTINIQNGNNLNHGGTFFNTTNTPNLVCIQVDDVAYATANWTNVDRPSVFRLDCVNKTYVPDNNFEQALIDRGNDFGPLDDYVYTEDVSSIENLVITSKGISSLIGIEDFTNLTELWMRTNQVTSMDLTQNVNLSLLVCGNNQLTEVDLSKNVALTAFTCENNNITTIDIKNGNNHNLPGIFFRVNDNPIECINVDDVAYSSGFWPAEYSSYFSEYCDAYNTSVPDDIFENYLETHDASGALVTLGDPTSMGNGIANDNYVSTANINTVESLDVSALAITNLTGIEDFTALTSLLCYYNDLTALDVSQNTALTTLECDNNNISTLDLSQNTALIRLWVGNASALTSLNLKNGNNANLVFLRMNDTPNLSCIQVDTQTIADNWNISLELPTDLVIDPHMVFTTNCGTTSVPDDNFEQRLIDLGYDSGPLNDYVYTSNINTRTSLDVYGQNIVDLTGIEDFTALTYLVCGNNQIESLDVSQNLALTNLFAYNNQLKNVNLGSNTNFIPIFGLDLNGNTDLTCITVDDQATADLWNTENYFNDGDGNSTLGPQMVFNTFCVPYGFTYVPDDNFENYFETHDFYGNPVPFGNSNSMGNRIANDNFVYTSNIELYSEFTLDLSGLNISNFEGLQDVLYTTLVNLSDNQLTTLNLDNFGPYLLGVNVNNNPLTQIEGYNDVLEYLDISNTNFTSLNLSNNLPNLIYLLCNDNPQLVSLNIKNGNNVNFGADYTSFLNCPNLTCIEVDDVAYSTTNWTNIDAHTAFSNNCGEVIVEAKAYLQGAFMNPRVGEEAFMRDDLRANGLIPTTSPYPDNAVCNTSVFSVIGVDAIVDWIWVELRDDATNTMVIASQSALLQRDGDIVDIDGVSPIVFAQNAKHYNVVINHRNHSGIMTADRQPFPKNQVQNFMDGSTTTLGSNSQVNMNGTIAQWAGDLNSDGKIQFSGGSNDVNTLKDFILENAAIPLLTLPVNGYYNADLNLTGSTKFSGPDNESNLIKDIILGHPVNLILGLPTFTITSQVPQN